MASPAGSTRLDKNNNAPLNHLTEQEHGEHEQALLDLIDQYDALPAEDTHRARLRIRFLEMLKTAPPEVSDMRISDFLTQAVQREDLDQMVWEKPEDVLAFSESIYNYEFDDTGQHKKATEQVRDLLHSALHQFEAAGDFDKMIRLLILTPSTLGIEDAELLRLRNRVYLYEMRHVAQRRRWLYAYLGVQAVLIFFVFPLLFIQAENAVRTTASDLVPPLTFLDGLYWSLITAGSIGYGDVTPITDLGKVLAALLGMFGVITVGIIAGLILQWILPRRI